MSAIKLSTPSSGSISLSPANTASNLTITVPASTSTMLTTTSNLAGLTGVGKVLQVVQTSSTASFSTSSTSYVATGHTASITPSSATSRILIIYGGNWCIQGANTQVDVTVRSNQGASNLGLATFYSATASGFTCVSLGLTFLDSPATTSALTYTLHVKEAGVPGTISTGTELKTLTLMEIAA